MHSANGLALRWDVLLTSFSIVISPVDPHSNGLV